MDRIRNTLAPKYRSAQELLPDTRLFLIAIIGVAALFVLPVLGEVLVGAALALAIVLHWSRDRRVLVLALVVLIAIGDSVNANHPTGFSAWFVAIGALLVVSLLADSAGTGTPTAAGR